MTDTYTNLNLVYAANTANTISGLGNENIFTSNIGNSKDLYNLDQISKLPFVDVKEVENEIYKSDNR